MTLLIVLGLALALSAQAPGPLCPQGNFDGHWWLRANSCERQSICGHLLTLVVESDRKMRLTATTIRPATPNSWTCR
jgi:hypothetical protein